MGARSRRKGASAERELARLLRDRLGEGIFRNLMQGRDGGQDLLGLPGWSIEVKRAATRARLADWWSQAVAQAGSAHPALAYRLDRQPWRFAIHVGAINPDFSSQPLDLRFVAELDLAGFAFIVRESLPPSCPATPHPRQEVLHAVRNTQ